MSTQTRGALVVSLALLLGCAGPSPALPPRFDVDPETGWRVYTLSVEGPGGRLVARVVPEAGDNLFSLKLGGIELLRGPPSLRELPGYRYGTAVLYPTPNRVREAKFSFEAETFILPANWNGHHMNGLANSIPWAVAPPRHDAPAATQDESVLETYLDVKPGHPLYRHFPFDHRLDLRYALTREGLRMDFKVTNRDSRRLPFGFAFHPYFAVLGAREQTYLTVPASKHMEADKETLLPTGEVEGLDGSVLDLRKPVPLSALRLDDVYCEVDPTKSAGYQARDAGVSVGIEASAAFTHVVVYTPEGKDYFSIESQTCSTDAHNLAANGHAREAHLTVLEPEGSPSGSTAEGSVFWRIQKG